MSVKVTSPLTNIERARAAWGNDMPNWVRLLASACDTTNQRDVGAQLGKSSGYISKLINRNYPGDMDEAERLVRATFGKEDVVCPLWGPIPLNSCMTARRRKAPPRNHAHRLHRKHCPTCPINTDAASAAEEVNDEE